MAPRLGDLTMTPYNNSGTNYYSLTKTRVIREKIAFLCCEMILLPNHNPNRQLLKQMVAILIHPRITSLWGGWVCYDFLYISTYPWLLFYAMCKCVWLTCGILHAQTGLCAVTVSTTTYALVHPTSIIIYFLFLGQLVNLIISTFK